MSAQRLLFGDCVIDLAQGELFRAGQPVALRPKSFALLQYLVTHADRLIGKDELMAALWPGVIVTDDSLTRSISDVRAAIGDDAQTMIKTVARRGYRFAAPVHAAAPSGEPEVQPAPAQPGAPAAAHASPQPSAAPGGPPRGRRAGTAGRAAAIAGLLGALALTVAVGWQASRSGGQSPASPPPPRLSLVVLPFVGGGEHPAEVADLITEDLTMALARLRGTTVIAASSASTYKDGPVDVLRVGRELKVRYALQGTLLRTPEQLRVGARLTDTTSGRMLWSDHFDATRAELPRVMDAIVLRLASALEVELVRAESQRLVGATPESLEADDIAVQCEAASSFRQEPSELCRRALALDPRNVRALAALGYYYADRAERRQSADLRADQAQAQAWVARALEVDPDYYAVHCANAVVLTGQHRVREAIVSAQRCRTLNPSHARVYRILASLHFFLAEPDQTLAWVAQGLRISPRDPQMAGLLLFRGWALFQLGRDDEAIATLREAAAAGPNGPSTLPPLISLLALTGRDAAAREVLARYAALDSTRAMSVSRWEGQPDDNPAFLRFAERFKRGLRQAGMPD